MTKSQTRLALAALLLALAGAGTLLLTFGRPAPPVETKPVGLMTSLPIYWSDDADFTSLVDGSADAPHIRRVLERRFELVPLDTLAPAPALGDGPAQDPLATTERLLVAQPRGLSPADNVALDEWVRAGGRLLLVLDPMLTGAYSVSLGDPRHPVATALIPPVVRRWGLMIQYDERQDLAPRLVETAFGAIQVHVSGEVVIEDEGAADCTLDGEAVIATCTIGAGRVTLVADAYLFEIGSDNTEAEEALLALAARAFD